MIERFRAATRTGDLQPLMDVLAPDVVLLTDGGGLVQAALKPIHGVDKVLRFLSGVQQPDTELVAATVNGAPGFEIRVAGALDAVATMQVENGLVRTIYVVRNPDKLARSEGQVALTRA